MVKGASDTSSTKRWRLGNKSHVSVRFLHDYKIRMRAKQCGRKVSKEVKRKDFQKWHATFRELCTRRRHTMYDKNGEVFCHLRGWRLTNRPYNLSLIRSSLKKETIITIPGHGSGLDRLVLFRPKGNRPRLAIIFRGKGRVAEDEKMAWNPTADVYFQEIAWVDQQVCDNWIKTTLDRFLEEDDLDRYLLLVDNLSSQEQESFKEKISNLVGSYLVWLKECNGFMAICWCRLCPGA